MYGLLYLGNSLTSMRKGLPSTEEVVKPTALTELLALSPYRVMAVTPPRSTNPQTIARRQRRARQAWSNQNSPGKADGEPPDGDKRDEGTPDGDKNETRNSGNQNANPDDGCSRSINNNAVGNPVHGSPNTRRESSRLLHHRNFPTSSSSSRRITVEEEYQSIVQGAVEDLRGDMAARNNRPRAGFPKPEPGAAQEETNMWETIKADMMRANGLKRQSDEKLRLYTNLRARIGDLTSTFMFVLTHHVQLS